jgi:hypothetical protein
MWTRGLLSTYPHNRIGGICVSIPAYIGALRNVGVLGVVQYLHTLYVISMVYYFILTIWLSRQIEVPIG